jgi:hypothetical protein
MPMNVMDAIAEAEPLQVQDIPAAIVRALAERGNGLESVPERHPDLEAAHIDDISPPVPIEPGRPSYSCPDCGGVLEEATDGGPLRFRCRVGHAFYADDSSAAGSSTLEDALWSAVRKMEETAELSKRLARLNVDRGASRSASRHRERSREVLEQAEVIRDYLLGPAVTEGAEEDRGTSAARVAS